MLTHFLLHFRKSNYSSPVADVQDFPETENARGSSTGKTRARADIENKINKLDHHVKRIGRVHLREVESTIRTIEDAGLLTVLTSFRILSQSRL